MKIPILSGNVLKRETIEESTVSARTGKLSAYTMVNNLQVTSNHFYNIKLD